jgi:hypothetical protein
MDRRINFSVRLTKLQYDALQYGADMLKCKKTDLLRIVLLPFIFDYDPDKEYPVLEKDYKRWIEFLQQCADIQKLL